MDSANSASQIHQDIRPPHFVGVIHVDQQRQMEITIANMAEDRRNKLEFGGFALGRIDAFGEPRNRNADIRGEGHCARPQMTGREIAVMARLPKPAAFFRLGRPIERSAAQFGDDFSEPLAIARPRSRRYREIRRTASALPAATILNRN